MDQTTFGVCLDTLVGECNPPCFYFLHNLNIICKCSWVGFPFWDVIYTDPEILMIPKQIPATQLVISIHFVKTPLSSALLLLLINPLFYPLKESLPHLWLRI